MPNHYTTLAVCSPGYDFDVDEFNEKHAETDLCRVVMPMPEVIEQVPEASYPDGTNSRERLGEDDSWYTWANEHWGTKWGTYDAKAFALDGDGEPILIKFQSAWRAPKILAEIAEWLMKVGRFERVAFIGFDPYDDSTQMLGEHRKAMTQ